VKKRRFFFPVKNKQQTTAHLLTTMQTRRPTLRRINAQRHLKTTTSYWLECAIQQINAMQPTDNAQTVVQTIFEGWLKIVDITSCEWQKEENGTISSDDGGKEVIKHLGSGTYGQTGYLNHGSEIHSHSAVKQLTLDDGDFDGLKNWLTESVICLAVERGYDDATRRQQQFSYAALQHPLAKLLWIGCHQKQCLSGMFVYEALDEHIEREDPASILLQTAAVFDYIHKNLSFRFMHKDLHFGNLMLFKSSVQPTIAVSKDLNLVQDERNPLADKKIYFGRNPSDNKYSRFKIIDFGFAWLKTAQGTVLSAETGVYPAEHDFNDQHDTRTLVVSLYEILCTTFDKKTQRYHLKTSPETEILWTIVNVAGRHSARFKMVTDVGCITEIHNFVNFNADLGHTKHNQVVAFDVHAQAMAALLGNGVTFEETAHRLRDLYECMMPQLVRRGRSRLYICHFMYAFMVEHRKTPIFKPANLFNYILSFNTSEDYIIK